MSAVMTVGGKRGAGRRASRWEARQPQVMKVLHTDTLLYTLRRMRQLGSVLALVVDAWGRPVGVVTEEELVRAWASGPLVEVRKVMCPGAETATTLAGAEVPGAGEAVALEAPADLDPVADLEMGREEVAG
jgi:CBS domain-containing protein